MSRRSSFLKSAAFQCILAFCLVPVFAVIGVTGLRTGQAYFPQKYQVHGLHVTLRENPVLYWVIEAIWLIGAPVAFAGGCRYFWKEVRTRR